MYTENKSFILLKPDALKKQEIINEIFKQITCENLGNFQTKCRY